MTNPERVDRAEIRRHLALITAPGQIIKVRAVGAVSGRDCRQPHIIAGHFDDHEKLAAAVADYITRAEGICVTLNEVNPALLARACNRLVDRLRPTTGDADVLRRRIFYVDVDPVRPAQISATDAEHTLAFARTQQISAYLQELGAPAPLLADSGNGAITAGCQHQSCQGTGWPELRALREGAHPYRRENDAEHAAAPTLKLPQPAEATLGAECRDPDGRRPDKTEPAAPPGGAMGAGGGEPLGPRRLPAEPPPWLGEDGRDSGILLPPAKAAPRRSTRKKITSSYLINYLAEQGYAFRLNRRDDSVEVGGERISDVSRAQMRCQLRDAGLGQYLAAADDAVIASAASRPTIRCSTI